MPVGLAMLWCMISFLLSLQGDSTSGVVFGAVGPTALDRFYILVFRKLFTFRAVIALEIKEVKGQLGKHECSK